MNWHQKIPIIAEHLGELTGETITVTAERPALAALADGRGIHFHQEHGRLVITGRYPTAPGWHHHPGWDEENNQRTELPRITVYPERFARYIALDIARRFWPAYQSEYDRARAQYLDHLAQEERKASYRRLLAEAGAGHVTATFADQVSGSHWRATVGRAVELRLDGLDIETACEIVRLVAQANGHR